MKETLVEAALENGMEVDGAGMDFGTAGGGDNPGDDSASDSEEEEEWDDIPGEGEDEAIGSMRKALIQT
jgi:hypothetical protein